MDHSYRDTRPGEWEGLRKEEDGGRRRRNLDSRLALQKARWRVTHIFYVLFFKSQSYFLWNLELKLMLVWTVFVLLLLLNCWSCSDWGWIWVNWWGNETPPDFVEILGSFSSSSSSSRNCEICAKKWMVNVGVGPIWLNPIYYL